MKQFSENFGAVHRVEFNVPVDMMNEAEMRQLLKAILARADGDSDASLGLFEELVEAEFSAFGQEGQITAADIQAACNHVARKAAFAKVFKTKH